MPITPRLPEGCVSEPSPAPEFDGRAWVSAWVVTCAGGLEGGSIVVEGLERTRTDVLVRYELRPGETRVQRLTATQTGFVIPSDAGPLDIMASYIGLGVTHILEGIDHLMFVFALVLLVRDRRQLFWAITAFTLAHSLSLAAATFGWLRIPSAPVEAVVALSIVFLAYELTLPPERRDPLTMRAPWLVSFGFGLIHGLGFASALREIGLPEDDIPLALLAFNIGVELGQILFILLVLAIGAAASRLYPATQASRTRLVLISSYALGSIASFWTIERVVSFQL
jgi:hydrogenase/urease accessory protein HupE